MRLGLMAGYSGATIHLPMDAILEADRLGYYAIWTAEAYGSDSVSPLAWIGAQTKNLHLGTAIMQMPARSPAMTAMTAITLDQLSGGRMLLGLGLSGPQVVEGWHGQAYGKPLGKTREYVKIVRTIMEREETLVHTGAHYQIPYTGDGATGLGKPLKSIIHGRSDLPIYLAAIGPKNVQLAAEIANGWLPTLFSPTYYKDTYQASVEAGFAKANANLAAGETASETPKDISQFDIAPTVQVAMGDNLDECRARVKPGIALYVGGMGARGKNFYFDAVSRYGYGDAAIEIQDLYLAGKKMEAMEAVPDALVDEVSLCGPKERIAELLKAWEDSPVTTMNLGAYDIDVVRTMAELVMGERVNTTNQTIVDLNQSSNEPTTEPEEASVSDLKSTALFEGMSARINSNPDVAKKVNAIFQFNITDDSKNVVGSWVVDLKGDPPSVSAGESGDAECTMTMSDDTFAGLVSGEVNGMNAFMSGKIKVAGNMMLATKLQDLMK